MPEQFTLLDTDTLITARSSGFGHVPNGSLADLVAIRYQIERGARYLGRDVDILVGSTSVVGAYEWLAGAHSGFHPCGIDFRGWRMYGFRGRISSFHHCLPLQTGSLPRLLILHLIRSLTRSGLTEYLESSTRSANACAWPCPRAVPSMNATYHCCGYAHSPATLTFGAETGYTAYSPDDAQFCRSATPQCSMMNLIRSFREAAYTSGSSRLTRRTGFTMIWR
jgi:hypothetical protein